jgi:hypothetical protein
VHALNHAREQQDSGAVLLELKTAETLLAQIRDVDPKAQKQRRHLLGALGTVVKTKELSAIAVDKAQTLIDKYKKKKRY